MFSASGLQGCLCHPTGEASCCQKAQQQHGTHCTLHANEYIANNLCCVLAALVAGALRRRLQTCCEHCSHSALLGKNPAWHRSLRQCVLPSCLSLDHNLYLYQTSLTTSWHLLLTSCHGYLHAALLNQSQVALSAGLCWLNWKAQEEAHWHPTMLRPMMH